MKTTVKQLAAGTFFALLILVVNVKAEGTEKKASGRERIQTSLQLEKWMTDETVWKTNTMNSDEFVQETETSLELENWMTSEKIWNLNDSFVEEVDRRIEIEPWMIHDEKGNRNKIKSASELKVEDWMINNKVWK